MTFVNQTYLSQIAAVIITGALLMGCGGSDSIASDIDKDIEEAVKNSNSTIHFVNATTEMADFHLKYSTLSNSVYDSEFQVASVLEGEVSEPYLYQWNDKLADNDIAVIDTNTLMNKARTRVELQHGTVYWGIGWRDNNQYAISIVEAQDDASINGYTLRFFSTVDTDIYLDEDVAPRLSVEKGKISNPITLENCADLARINDVSTHFCQQANVGENYLVVLNEHQQIMIAQRG